MIMASLDAPSGTLPCYTFGSMYRDTYDVRVSRKVARQCGQPHHVLVLGEAFVRDSPDYLEKAVFISDGYLGLSGAAELYLNGLARQIAPVRITGNYGGEMLRGFRAFNSSRPRGGFLSADLARRVDAGDERVFGDERGEPSLVHAVSPGAFRIRTICNRAFPGDRPIAVSRRPRSPGCFTGVRPR